MSQSTLVQSRFDVFPSSWVQPSPEVIKLEFILRLIIKRNDWLLVDTCPQSANECFYFESKTVLKFYNLEVSTKQIMKCLSKGHTQRSMVSLQLATIQPQV